MAETPSSAEDSKRLVMRIYAKSFVGYSTTYACHMRCVARLKRCSLKTSCGKLGASLFLAQNASKIRKIKANMFEVATLPYVKVVY
jgi:hypothetical protein